MHKKRHRHKKGSFEYFFENILRAIMLPFRSMIFKFANWLSHLFSSSPGKKCVTKRGEKVKSVAEKRIADFLFHNNVEYVYEKRLPVWFFKVIRPDFYLPGKNLYIEYYGLIKHPFLGEKYKRERAYKKKQYDRLGISIIELDHRHYNNIESHLKSKLKNF